MTRLLRPVLSSAVMVAVAAVSLVGQRGTPLTEEQAAARWALVKELQSLAIVDRKVMMPMRDGVLLRADLYRPAGAGPFPVLVFRTPYGKHYAALSDGVHAKAVARGYAVLMQDVRGRYASEGHFDPYRQERKDGYDTIEWAAAQPWSDGRVGTWGLSYPGAVQWLAALAKPPHLVSMAPAMTFSSPRRFFYMAGLFDRSWLPWISLSSIPTITSPRLSEPSRRSLIPTRPERSAGLPRWTDSITAPSTPSSRAKGSGPTMMPSPARSTCPWRRIRGTTRFTESTGTAKPTPA